MVGVLSGKALSPKETFMEENKSNQSEKSTSFFDKEDVKVSQISIAGGIPLGMKSVSNKELGISGVYGTWGASVDNESLPRFLKTRLGSDLVEGEIMSLDELGFLSRHHIPDMSSEDHLKLEVEVGTQILRESARANGWNPSEIQGVLIGMSCPVSNDYVAQISERAGIPGDALKVTVHKACDGSMGALHLALNPELSENGKINIAEELKGKKVLVGGIEGLSRLTAHSKDKNALQLFGNGAGVIGVVPGETMKFLVGKSHENFDEEGLLQLRMFYPHSRKRIPGVSLLELQYEDLKNITVAGLMNEPQDGAPIFMAGLMGMVKLFVRTGVDVVTDVYKEYQALLDRFGQSGKSIEVAIAHHANYKINLLKAKQLMKNGVQLPMPWLLNDFGNVSAASCMIAFLRYIQNLKPGDHVLFDGFGAGTYYDVMAVSMG
jgi:3-oxoacyl-[acyl-carrier-protein] synthase III